MIDSPLVLIFAGMSAVSALAFWTSRRKRRTGSSLAHLSAGELETLRHSLSPDASVHEVRRVTLVLVEEEIRRRRLLITG
jgi:hypothetical protein